LGLSIKRCSGEKRLFVVSENECVVCEEGKSSDESEGMGLLNSSCHRRGEGVRDRRASLTYANHQRSSQVLK
jgi:hypothetical protein